MQQLCVCEVKLCTHELLTTYGLKGRFVDFQSPCLFSKTLQALKTRTRRNPGPAGTLNQQESWTSRNPRPAGTLNQQEPWTCRNPRPAGTLNQQESWTSRNPGPAGIMDQQETWICRNRGTAGTVDEEEAWLWAVNLCFDETTEQLLIGSAEVVFIIHLDTVLTQHLYSLRERQHQAAQHVHITLSKHSVLLHGVSHVTNVSSK